MSILRKLLLVTILLTLSGCGDTARRIELRLEDGTHTSGLLLAVEGDWLVIDRNINVAEPDILVVDKSVVDTAILPGEMGDLERAEFIIGGAAAGALGGYWAGEGFIPDSTRPSDPKRSTAATIGTVAGIALGSALGILLTDVFKPGNIVFVKPEEEQYDSIRSFAKYPEGLPADLREALDSGWEWKVEKN